MNFNQNEDAVAEVFDIAKNQRVLTQTSFIQGSHIERDFSSACRMAWDDVYGAKYSWTDIREREKSKLNSGTYHLSDAQLIQSELHSAHKSLLYYLKKNLSGEYSTILDDVFADLSNCAFKRAFFGMQPGFFEHIFQIYKSGGWPCGWHGNYPYEGEIVAFYARTAD